MKILVVNDDGVYSPGIYALAQALDRDSHSVTIIAPDANRSCISHSVTIYTPIEVQTRVLPGLEHVMTYAISGTPVDCVRLGLAGLAEEPDLVVSGINTGSNLGYDVYCSGTVNAAAAAVERGLPAIAVSITSNQPNNLDTAATVSVNAIHRLLPQLAGEARVLVNINVPDIPPQALRGVKVTPLAPCNSQYPFHEITSSRNKRFFWDAAGEINSFTSEDDVDERWIRDGYITVTPLHFELTCREQLKLLNQQMQTLL